ncbi:MAG: AbrB/MazE/SpoVT family DNA-binding domain-containing protein [Candidatus Sumerlaeia bacterium]
MVSAKVSSKGQITIPQDVRESLHLEPGDRVSFELSDSNEVIMRVLNRSVADVFGKYKKPGQQRKSVAQMEKAVAENMRKKRA